jgi:hypothetical protein
MRADNPKTYLTINAYTFMAYLTPSITAFTSAEIVNSVHFLSLSEYLSKFLSLC